jgi:poly(A) polymerase
VRFIGSPAQRIEEDYLRILRFFRFTAEYAAGAPDAAGLAACVAGRDGLALLSAERVRQEMLRLLVAARGPELVGWMVDYGLSVRVLPAVPRPGLLGRLAALEAATGGMGDAVLRLAALAVEVEEDAVRLTERLRLSGTERVRLLRAADHAPDIGPPAPESAARLWLYREGVEAYRQRLIVAWLRSGAPPTSPAWRHRLTLPQRWQPPRLPLGGADVVALGVAPGPSVGALLRALEAWWIAGDFAADADALRARLAALVAGAAAGKP